MYIIQIDNLKRNVIHEQRVFVSSVRMNVLYACVSDQMWCNYLVHIINWTLY